MGRYSATVSSSAALAANTGFFWLMAPAGSGCKLRRITGGVVAGATTPTSQQVSIGIARTTNAGTTGTPVTAHKLDPNSPSAAMVPNSAFSTPPTLVATDQFLIPFNTQSGFDLPWEQLEEWVISAGTTNGIALLNRVNALPTSHLYQVSVEWEE
jgi:hypothetical protein